MLSKEAYKKSQKLVTMAEKHEGVPTHNMELNDLRIIICLQKSEITDS